MENEEYMPSIFDGDWVKDRAERSFIFDRVSRALTDPAPNYRKIAVDSLRKTYPDLVSITARDNHAFVSFGNSLEICTVYVGDLPKKEGEYQETYNHYTRPKPSQIPPIEFMSENNEIPFIEFLLGNKNYTLHGKHKKGKRHGKY